MFKLGDKVKKVTGDYNYWGEVVACFTKIRSNAVTNTLRVVVENEDGMLFIFNPFQLEPWDGEKKS